MCKLYINICNANAENWNILVTAGREINHRDSLSSGERNGKSLAIIFLYSYPNFLESLSYREWKPRGLKLYKKFFAVSKTRHEKSCLNKGGPSSKTKY